MERYQDDHEEPNSRELEAARNLKFTRIVSGENDRSSNSDLERRIDKNAKIFCRERPKSYVSYMRNIHRCQKWREILVSSRQERGISAGRIDIALDVCVRLGR